MKRKNVYYLPFSYLLPVIIFLLTGCKGKTKTISQSETPTQMYMYVIERDVPGAGKMTQQELKELSQKSCEVLRELGPQIEWAHSYVTEDKLYCVYRAKDSSLIRLHAQLGGFPANKITLAGNIISPKTAELEFKE